ncbi:MAG: hypothetical protein ABI401_12690 [Candidatus Dormibacter sp.]
MVGKGVSASISDREADFYRAMDRASTVLKEDDGPPVFRRVFNDLLDAANVFQRDVDQLFINTHREVRTIRRLCAREELRRWQTEPVFCRPQ